MLLFSSLRRLPSLICVITAVRVTSCLLALVKLRTENVIRPGQGDGSLGCFMPLYVNLLPHNNRTWHLGTAEVFCLLDSVGQGSGAAELVVMAQHFFWVYSQEVSRLQLSEGLTRAGESAPSVACSHGCWQENSVLPHMGFSTGPLKCAHDLWLSPQWVI